MTDTGTNTGEGKLSPAKLLAENQRLKERLIKLTQADTRRHLAEDALRSQARDLRRTEEVLRSSRNKLAAVFDAINDVVFAVDEKHKVSSVNMAAAELARSHPRDLVGLPCHELVDLLGNDMPPGAACGAALKKVFESSQPSRRTEKVDSKDGPMFFELTHTPVLEEDGRVGLAIVHVRDTTLQRRMEMTIREYSELLEHKVAERTAELGRANSELRRLDKLRRDLTRMMVHDLKSPLSEVLGNLEIIAADPLTPLQEEYLDLARVSADDLFRMILNLLDVSRLSEGRLPLRPHTLDFKQLATELAGRFATVSRLRQIDITVEDRAQGLLYGDEEILWRVLMNLLTNALSHTPDQGSVVMSCRPEDGGATITVSDTGSGIPEEFRARIFEQFTQGDEGARTSTGLGLAFCKLAIGAHGGRIWFDSVDGQGANFYCWLPLEGSSEGLD